MPVGERKVVEGEDIQVGYSNRRAYTISRVIR